MIFFDDLPNVKTSHTKIREWSAHEHKREIYTQISRYTRLSSEFKATILHTVAASFFLWMTAAVTTRNYEQCKISLREKNKLKRLEIKNISSESICIRFFLLIEIVCAWIEPTDGKPWFLVNLWQKSCVNISLNRNAFQHRKLTNTADKHNQESQPKRLDRQYMP